MNFEILLTNGEYKVIKMPTAKTLIDASVLLNTRGQFMVATDKTIINLGHIIELKEYRYEVDI